MHKGAGGEAAAKAQHPLPGTSLLVTAAAERWAVGGIRKGALQEGHLGRNACWEPLNPNMSQDRTSQNQGQTKDPSQKLDGGHLDVRADGHPLQEPTADSAACWGQGRLCKPGSRPGRARWAPPSGHTTPDQGRVSRAACQERDRREHVSKDEMGSQVRSGLKLTGTDNFHWVEAWALEEDH